MTVPLVSVVLSVRNGGADLPKAVSTILEQTFANFELIAINNGSSDDTASILDGSRDPRMRVVHQEDMGLAGALNRGIALARGRYVARQDHDDWARPTRLVKQVAFMEANADCAMLGTRAEIWVGDQPTGRFHDHPTDNAALQFELLFDNPFVHSSMMLRKSALEAVGGYPTDPARQPPEDYELWSRLARRFRVANLAERLTIYREVPNSMSRGRTSSFQEKLVVISAESLAAATGQTPPSRHHWDIAALTHGLHGRMSADPDIERMCGVVREAGALIHAADRHSDVPKRVADRIDRLRHLHARYRMGPHRAGLLAGIARRSAILRRLGRRLERLIR